MHRKTITGLLAAIVVLLGLNLIVMGPRAVNAGTASGGPPYVVKLLPVINSTYRRVWSDGRVDSMDAPIGSCDFLVPQSYGPVEHPFPVVDAIIPNNSATAVMVTYGDGRVDLIGFPTGLRCTVAGIGTQSFCTADVDRNGEVDATDFFEVIAQWGSSCR